MWSVTRSLDQSVIIQSHPHSLDCTVCVSASTVIWQSKDAEVADEALKPEMKKRKRGKVSEDAEAPPKEG